MLDPAILFVDGDPVSRAILEPRLCRVGCPVLTVPDPDQALATLRTRPLALLVADLAPPPRDGLALLRTARALQPDLELIALAARPALDTALPALHLGVRAYLPKPVLLPDLDRHVAAALDRWRLRRLQFVAFRQLGATLLQLAHAAPGPDGPASADLLRIGPLRLDLRRRRAVLDERPLPLSHGEFELLRFLACRPEEVVSPERLAREVLGYACEPHEARELIKARVHRLRRKLEPNPRRPRFLVNVRGAGYMLTAGDHEPEYGVGADAAEWAIQDRRC